MIFKKDIVLIIDEINGDLSRVFGELIFGLEYRGQEIQTTLSKDLKPLIIPENLYIIGTMNSVDRSIAFMDYALKRCFLFIEILPENGILERFTTRSKGIMLKKKIKFLSRVYFPN